MAHRKNPFEELERLFDQMSRQFEQMNDSWRPWQQPVTGWVGNEMPLDIADEGDVLVVTVDIPGFEKSDIDARVDGDMLHIEAMRESTAESRSEKFLHQERRTKSISRSVSLPMAVDEEGVSASYHNGVLTLRLKKAASEGTHIDIE